MLKNKKLLSGLFIVLLIGFVFIISNNEEKVKIEPTAQSLNQTQNQIKQQALQENNEEVKLIEEHKIIQEDLKLSIEELKNKYPINWWNKKFGSIEKTKKGACDSNDFDIKDETGKVIDCEPYKKINELTSNQIKSIFVHYNEIPYQAGLIPKTIMKDIHKKQENSEYFYLKDFIYSKTILMNMEYFGCGMIETVSKNLLYYRKLIISKVGQNILIGCIPDYLKDDEEIAIEVLKYYRGDYFKRISPRLQKIYKEEGLEGLKKRVKQKSE